MSSADALTMMANPLQDLKRFKKTNVHTDFFSSNKSNPSVYNKLLVSVIKANQALRMPITEIQIKRA